MIKIICFGKVKNQNLRKVVEEYLMKINRYFKIEVIELKEEKEPKKPNKTLIEKNLEKEEESVEKYIKKENINIMLDEKGELLNTNTFYKKIVSNINVGKDIYFLIGSSNGFSKKIKNKIKSKISLSKMTFTNDETRYVLCEQIYRVFMIKNNKRYHK